ncbi:MAG: ion transporter [Candidatus Saccharimonadaceae bacterium]
MLQKKVKHLVNHHLFHRIVVCLIIINAVILGLKTYPSIMEEHDLILNFLDQFIIWLFVGEIILQFAAHGRKFLKDPWHIFDVVVITISLVPANAAFSVLRAVRALRILMLVETSATLRHIMASLFSAIPGIAGIATLLAILFYIFGIMATRLFGADFPQYFGNLQTSFFSLFQIMTLEGWPDIVRSIMQTYPYAWIFFITYIIIATYSILNLFIAVIIDAMEKQYTKEVDVETLMLENIQKEIQLLHNKIDNVKSK